MDEHADWRAARRGRRWLGRTYNVHSGPANMRLGLCLAALSGVGTFAGSAAFAVVTVLGGAGIGFLLDGAFTTAWRRRRTRRLAATRAPWLLDGYWSSSGESRFSNFVAPWPFARLLRFVLIASVPLLMIVAAYAQSGWGLVLAAASAATALTMSWRGFANVRVEYRKFPYRVGECVAFGFSFKKRFGAPALFDRATFTLQCVEETPRWGGLRAPRVRRLFATSIEKHEELPPSPFQLELEFDVPADARGADFLGPPSVYWELSVEGEGPGFRYDEEFLVPIYAADASAAGPVTP
jgi:hypothetical protein